MRTPRTLRSNQLANSDIQKGTDPIVVDRKTQQQNTTTTWSKFSFSSVCIVCEKDLTLCYLDSTYGHIWQMAEAIAEGARQVEGAEVVIKRVPETLPAEIVEKLGATQAQKAFEHIPVVRT